MNSRELRRNDLIHPELCYKIVGALFNVDNDLGPGHKEKYYQKAVAVELNNVGLSFQEQLYAPLIYKDKNVGKYYFDFLVEGIIVLEIKAGEKFLRRNIAQVTSYLKAKNLKLGIIANFTKEGVKYRRIVNLNKDS